MITAKESTTAKKVEFVLYITGKKATAQAVRHLRTLLRYYTNDGADIATTIQREDPQALEYVLRLTLQDVQANWTAVDHAKRDTVEAYPSTSIGVNAEPEAFDWAPHLGKWYYNA